ncbi:hypothetical virus protein [Klebsormidium nitens]|uniref:Hypothetical virus protein n=1 Tax=Klebsormidium nitens TaxID=105231 RepID=A0A1Y1INM0_KLENI|nr:hypothetical virus protein [Klebsormidium nitens]|eukprot:GAQ90386.1 hypothetical virus protein [Klebsormidium nitens]
MAGKRKRSGQLCVTNACTKVARSKNHCVEHGGGRRCLTEGCTKSAAGKTDHCVEHGGGHRCLTEGCTKSAAGKTDRCIEHGGGRRCLTEGCKKSAQGKTDHCIEHGGGRRCLTEGCTRGAQGKTDHCIEHGGGRRCLTEGCTKGAQGKTDHCIEHGGGRRCRTRGCTKAARGKTDHCVEHGGGRRCERSGCTKSAAGKTAHCVEHGGGSRCLTDGCTKSAVGMTDHCVEHGGGNRCIVCSGVSVPFSGGACYSCRSGTSLKKWETLTTQWLRNLDWPWSYNDETLPCANAMSTRDKSCIKRPDYVFVFETHAVILEVDENYHRYYEISCEVDRMGKIKDLVRLPLHFVRFNPAKTRYPLLKDLLERLFRDPEGAQNAAGVLVHFVGYPEDRIQDLEDQEEFCYEYERIACRAAM